jgi:hypothetical protein
MGSCWELLVDDFTQRRGLPHLTLSMIFQLRPQDCIIPAEEGFQPHQAVGRICALLRSECL